MLIRLTALFIRFTRPSALLSQARARPKGSAVAIPGCALDALENDPAGEGAVAFLVHVEPETERTVRINITTREKQLEEIDRLQAPEIRADSRS